MSCCWEKGRLKGLPSVWPRSEKYYSICNPTRTFTRTRHAFMEGRREQSKWSCSFLPTVSWAGELACYVTACEPVEAVLVRAVSPGKQMTLKPGRSVCPNLSGPFQNPFVPVCCWYPNQVWGLSMSSMRKLPCCLCLGISVASEVEAMLSAASQRFLALPWH